MSNLSYTAIYDSLRTVAVDVGTEDLAAPAALDVLAIGGRANAAEPTPDEGDYACLSFDLLSRLRAMVQTTPCSLYEDQARVADVQAAGAATGLRFYGFAAKETTGAAAAVFNICHGIAAGVVIVPVRLAANESTSDWFGPDGIAAANGIFFDFVSGSIDISIYHKTVL